MIIGDVVHYLTIMVAIGVALAVFGMFYKGADGDKMWNAGLLVAVFGVFASFYFHEQFHWNHAVAACCLVARRSLCSTSSRGC